MKTCQNFVFNSNAVLTWLESFVQQILAKQNCQNFGKKIIIANFGKKMIIGKFWQKNNYCETINVSNNFVFKLIIRFRVAGVEHSRKSYWDQRHRFHDEGIRKGWQRRLKKNFIKKFFGLSSRCEFGVKMLKLVPKSCFFYRI